MHIRIATLNAWALPGPLGRDVEERMAAIGGRLAQLALDAIAFQEVWTAEARELLLAAGRAAGLPHAWHKEAWLGGSGLVVLSRLPIASARFERFALRGFPERVDHGDYYGGKGFAEIVLETGAGPLVLVDTHLHARYPSDMPHEYRAHRVGEVVQLAARALDIAEPIVAVGDFNTVESEREYGVLTGLTGMRDAALEAGRPQPTKFHGNPYRSRNSHDKRKDFVFVRDGHRARLRVRGAERVFDEVFPIRGRESSYSDHAGVLAELEIEPGPPRNGAAADPGAVRAAAELLAEGRDEARLRRREGRALAGAGFGAALLAAAGLRGRSLSRRRLLRASLQGAALAALAPGVGYSLLSEVFVPDELRAFDTVSASLARFQPRPLSVARSRG
jgi:endonuclease/exonuclease/phosphatase family metal-dependent hydrolase